MKAGKKMQRAAQKRSIHHANAINERKRKGITDSEKGTAFRAPGSMNKKKLC